MEGLLQLTMATLGDMIAQDSFSDQWYETKGLSKYKSTDTFYVYIVAACWYAVVHANYAILGGSGDVTLYPFYWDGSAWVGTGDYGTHGKNGETTHRYGHNRDEGNLTASMHNDYPVWKIEIRPQRNNGNWDIDFYAGGYRLANAGDYPRGELFRSTGNATANIHMAGSSSLTPLSADWQFKAADRRGGLIYAENERELISYPY